MIAGREGPEARQARIAGVWVRATIATLLLTAAAIMTAYVLNAEDLQMNIATRRPALTDLAVADPYAPRLAGVERSPTAAAASLSFKLSRRDALPASATP